MLARDSFHDLGSVCTHLASKGSALNPEMSLMSALSGLPLKFILAISGNAVSASQRVRLAFVKGTWGSMQKNPSHKIDTQRIDSSTR